MTMLTVDGDLLSASSLALAALSVIYGLWTPQTDAALVEPKEVHRADRDPAIARMQKAQSGKAIPLAAATVLTTLALTPSVIAVCDRTVRRITSAGLSAYRDYEPGQALFVIVWSLLLTLSIVNVRKAVHLASRISEFKSA